MQHQLPTMRSTIGRDCSCPQGNGAIVWPRWASTAMKCRRQHAQSFVSNSLPCAGNPRRNFSVSEHMGTPDNGGGLL